MVFHTIINNNKLCFYSTFHRGNAAQSALQQKVYKCQVLHIKNIKTWRENQRKHDNNITACLRKQAHNVGNMWNK